MAATYKDIQKLTGLSLSTISKYFNGGSLREKNIKLIENAISGLDYRVNDLARGLKSKRSRSIGILIPELTSPFHNSIMSEASEHLRYHGYSTIVCDCHEDKAREEEALRFLLDKMVDGVITIPLNKTGKHLQIARDRGIPVVLVDRLTTQFQTDAVVIDNQLAGVLAAEKILENGHTAIAMMNGPSEIYTMKLRKKGFSKTLQQIGWDEKAWTTHIPFTVESGYVAAMKLLTKKQKPTAVFCANYDITLGLIMALNELDLRMPQDLSVVGFDNILLAEVIKPKMTMVTQPIPEIARQTVELILARLKNPASANRVVVLQPELIQGGSVGKRPMTRRK